MGQRIVRFRRRRGISQVVLAGLLGRSESWVSKAERGERGLDRLSVIEELARVLDVHPGALLGWEHNPPYPGGAAGNGSVGMADSELVPPT